VFEGDGNEHVASFWSAKRMNSLPRMFPTQAMALSEQVRHGSTQSRDRRTTQAWEQLHSCFDKTIDARLSLMGIRYVPVSHAVHGSFMFNERNVFVGNQGNFIHMNAIGSVCNKQPRLLLMMLVNNPTLSNKVHLR
jgi:hypothetical protein